jgi:hypothetical protein
MKNLFIFLLLTLFIPENYAFQKGSVVWSDYIFDERIKTVQLYMEGWNLSNPVIKLRSAEKLVLGFDLLADQPETYYYTIIHCDRNWTESSIFPNDYLDGLPEDQIDNYKPSFNTRINYFHYKLVIPNDRMSIKLSGNYILKVYKFGEPDKPAFTKRFMVTEELVRISASAHRPSMTEFYNTGQQVDVTVTFSSLRVADPYRDFSTFILQNGKWISSRDNLKPDFVSNNELKFNSLSEKNIFPAGNEYRYFDIKSIRYQSEYIRQIDFSVNCYHVFLFPSENREFKPYFYWQDFNGKYYVAVQEGRDMDTEADYVYVYFTLPSKYMVDGGKMYVSGAFNNWNFNNDNLMTYDSDKAQYQCTMLLKQGWYNYEYIFLREGEKRTGPSFFEGNHYETENEYLILVYYRNPVDRYDRLAGSDLTSSTQLKH